MLEIVKYPGQNSTTSNKILLLGREQVYLDKYKPSLNINKVAGSVMGYKHTELNKLKFGSIHRGKSYSKTLDINMVRNPVSADTISKLIKRAKGASVNVYFKDLERFKTFPTIKSAADYVGLSPSSVGKYIEKGTLWNDTYYFKLHESNEINSYLFKSNPINVNDSSCYKNYKSYKLEVLDTNNNIIYNFSSLRKASSALNISRDSIVRYIDKGSIWNGKFRFKIG